MQKKIFVSIIISGFLLQVILVVHRVQFMHHDYPMYFYRHYLFLMELVCRLQAVFFLRTTMGTFR